MGLPQLKQFTKTITPPIAEQALICVEDFLLVLAGNPILLSQFKTLIVGLKALVDAQIASLELAVTQLNVLNQVANALIQPYEAIKQQLASELSLYPFSQFNDCVIVQEVKDQVTKRIPSSPGPIGNLIRKIRSIDAWITAKKFQILQWTAQIQSINAQIENLKQSEIIFDAIAKAIDAQFPGA